MKKNTLQKREEALTKALSSKVMQTLLKERKIDPKAFAEFAQTSLKAKASRAPTAFTRIPDIGEALAPPINDRDSIIIRVGRRLNLDAFGKELHQELSSKRLSGYSMAARAGGREVYSLFWDWSRRPQDVNSLGWKPHTKMHVASVSKHLTAMAITKALYDMHMTVDSVIGPHLPRYIALGPNVANLTFRHLLTQTSGFNQDGLGTHNNDSYAAFKAHLENGVSTADVGVYRYHNVNFILLRVLLAVITKEVSPGLTLVMPRIGPFRRVDLSDLLWDYRTIDAYNAYVSYNILRPAGVTGKTVGDDTESLAYRKILSHKGAQLNAPNAAGTAGWWLSVQDLTHVLETFRSTSAIVPRQLARRALAQGFGLEPPDWWQHDMWGTVDCMTKSGYWSDGEGRTMQSVVAYAPPNFTIAVNVNSPIYRRTKRSSVSHNINDIVRELLRKHIS